MEPRPLAHVNKVRKVGHQYWDYFRHELEYEDGGKAVFHLLQIPDSVMIVPVTGNGGLLMIKQERYPNGIFAEFPGGGIKPNETPRQAADREFYEETGHVAERMKPAGSFFPSKALSSERCHVFIAYGLTPIRLGRLMEERVEVMPCSVASVDSETRQGQMLDAMTMACWLLVRPLLPVAQVTF